MILGLGVHTSRGSMVAEFVFGTYSTFCYVSTEEQKVVVAYVVPRLGLNVVIDKTKNINCSRCRRAVSSPQPALPQMPIGPSPRCCCGSGASSFSGVSCTGSDIFIVSRDCPHLLPATTGAARDILMCDPDRAQDLLVDWAGSRVGCVHCSYSSPSYDGLYHRISSDQLLRRAGVYPRLHQAHNTSDV